MAQSKLLVHPSHAADGVGHRITPASAGWRYVGFETRTLKQGAKSKLDTGDNEVCVVILSGKAQVSAEGFDSGSIGERASVFEGLPWSVYLPPHTDATIEAASDCQVALCSAPASGKFKARVIKPGDVGTPHRGTGSNARHVRNVLPEDAEARACWWSKASRPEATGQATRHTSMTARCAALMNPISRKPIITVSSSAQGFALQRIYTDDRFARRSRRQRQGDGDVVLVPKGTTLPARRTAMISTISNVSGGTEACLALLQRPRARVADETAFRVRSPLPGQS